MKQKKLSVKNYSINDLKKVIASINANREDSPMSDTELSLKINRNAGFIAQVRSRAKVDGKVSAKVIHSLQALQNAMNKPEGKSLALQEQEPAYAPKSQFSTLIDYLEDLKNGQVILLNQSRITRKEIEGVAHVVMFGDAKGDQEKLVQLMEIYNNIAHGEPVTSVSKSKMPADGKSGKGS